MKGNYPELEGKMDKAITYYKEELNTIRVGRANAAVLDKVFVDYYGTMTPIAQVASISTPDPKSLVIQPWDGSLLKPIEKAISSSEVGINPQNDGRVIRLVFPQLTEERRKELSKTVSKKSEEAKVSLRNVRRDAMDAYKAQKKKNEITEDDMKNIEKDIQELTDAKIREVEKITEKKQKEIMEI
ncbi:MAG: ribosome recycling factor [Clostridia bacterium]|nr:ribosome recycling factor [Clostridia bacterium]